MCSSPGYYKFSKMATPDLEFWETNLDENVIGLESSLEAEILVSNLTLYNLFVGKEKKLPFGNELISFNMDKV